MFRLRDLPHYFGLATSSANEQSTVINNKNDQSRRDWLTEGVKERVNEVTIFKKNLMKSSSLAALAWSRALFLRRRR